MDKEFLAQVFLLDREVRSMKEQIEMLRDESVSIRQVLSADKVQSTKVVDRIGNIVADIVDIENEYARLVTKRLMVKAEIIKAVEAVEDDVSRLILRERYVNLKRWEDIAEDNLYSVKHLHRLHNKALEIIENS
ncbi:hypothetical protein LJB89_00280 [Tyzzerella sp. OttesenSCG-928-J15]|nr:hypothetical protein [Tyzzerella sp. OttesenSCG-928-J15]